MVTSKLPKAGTRLRSSAGKRVETQNPAHLALVAERLLASHRTLDGLPKAWICYAVIWLATARWILLKRDLQAVLETRAQVAYQLARDELRRNPACAASTGCWRRS